MKFVNKELTTYGDVNKSAWLINDNDSLSFALFIFVLNMSKKVQKGFCVNLGQKPHFHSFFPGAKGVMWDFF